MEPWGQEIYDFEGYVIKRKFYLPPDNINNYEGIFFLLQHHIANIQSILLHYNYNKIDNYHYYLSLSIIPGYQLNDRGLVECNVGVIRPQPFLI